MSQTWRSGDFDRSRLSPSIRRFAPAHAAEHLVHVKLDALWERGKRLLLLDVDNTLVQWRGNEFAPEVLEWIETAKRHGFEICMISNTRKVERLHRLAETLGVAVVRGRFKPSRAMFRLALIKFKRKPEEAIMIGDQMMTDILGANRAGIDAIWVRKMEGREFSGTKVNRAIERFLTSKVYEALITPVDEDPGPEPKRTLQNQLIKFAIVGGSSFVIDYCIRMTLTYGLPIGDSTLGDLGGHYLQAHLPSLFGVFESPKKAFWPVACVVGGTFGILNSFIWNRRWTFEIKGKAGRQDQLRKFIVISVIGLCISASISTAVLHVIPGDEKAISRLGTILGVGVAAIWNFGAQRLYAFRGSKS